MATASDAVVRAIGAGWMSACNGLAAVCSFEWQRRPGDKGPYRTLEIRAGERRVQVSISPSGRSVRVFVDGDEIP